ncbi:MAG: DUF4446 family protein [Lachnospiraceae bacterium]|nr:DUF4446 family protein [Lachnospiraceae bacterium]
MKLFESLGLDGSWFIIGMMAFLLVLTILYLVLFKKYSKLKKNYDRFMKGSDAGSLEEVMQKRFAEIDELKLQSMNLKEVTDKLSEGLIGAYQKRAIVKYDAFKEMGGKLSFSLALLTNSNDGFILTSMHSSTGGCYTYIKEIIKGESFILLSEEEKQVLNDAINQNNYME